MYSEKEVLLSSIFPSLEAAIFTNFFCVWTLASKRVSGVLYCRRQEAA